MIKKFRKLAVGAALVASLCGLAGPVKADSFELTATQDAVTLDAKVAKDVAPNVGLFAKHAVTRAHEGGMGYFGLTDLSYDTGTAFSPTLEAQFIPDLGIVPRFGVGYFNALGDASVYALPSVSLTDSPDAELFVSAGYDPKGTGFSARTDFVSHYDKDGHAFTVGKPRVCYGTDDLEVCLAADLSKARDVPFGKSLGLSVRSK